LIFIVFLVCVAFFVYYEQREVRTGELYYSGTVEATTSELAFQANGRVVNIFVDEGQQVKEGQVLAELDQSQYLAQVAEAKARVNQSEKNMERLKTLVDVYRKTLPAKVQRAEAAVVSSTAVALEARKNAARYDSLYQRGVVSKQEWEAIVLNSETAEAKVREARAILRQAESNLRQIDAAKKEVEVAKAQHTAAKASLDFVEVQLEYTRLHAPFNGVVTSQNVERGEVVTAGREALTLSDLSKVELKIFVAETEIGNVRPGQKVDVKIDTFTDTVFKGTVSYISPEGEFTPKIIQTHKERVKLVYLVKVIIPNPRMELKTGMPADAWLR